MTAQSLGPPGERIAVALLTGFLGSGKTTVLNRLLRHPDLTLTAVIINEFGQIALDHFLVEKSTEDMVVLGSGCVCCSVRNDLLETLETLWQRRERGEIPPFTRVIIETTGLADPAPILQTVLTDEELVTRYWLDAILVTVDVANAPGTLDRHYESVKQVAVADRLLLTKLDLVDEAAATSLAERLRAINPTAPQIPLLDDTLDPATLFDAGLFHARSPRADVDCWLGDDAFGGVPSPGQHRHDDHIHSFCLVYDEPLALRAFEEWMSVLAELRGPDLLRVKGIVHLRELSAPAVVHWVQHLVHPPVMLPAWPTSDRRTRMVFITRDIPREAIEAALDRALDRQ